MLVVTGEFMLSCQRPTLTSHLPLASATGYTTQMWMKRAAQYECAVQTLVLQTTKPLCDTYVCMCAGLAVFA